jgi:hypothetical protein
MRPSLLQKIIFLHLYIALKLRIYLNIVHSDFVKNMYFYEFLLYLVRSELVGVVEMSELQTWYEKVTRDDQLQLMCCALSDSIVSIYEGSGWKT